MRSHVLTLGVVLLAGCGPSRVSLQPDAPQARNSMRLAARIFYQGNPADIPAVLAEAAPGDDAVRADYRTTVRYTHSSAWQFFNPLLVFGFHGIGADARVDATLDVRSARHAMHYAATCTARVRQSIYSFRGPSDSDLRRRGLACVARLLEADLCREEGTLRTQFPGAVTLADDPTRTEVSR